MKKTLIISAILVSTIIGLFLFLKWDQLKYYFRLDNSELNVSLIDSPDDEIRPGELATYTYEIKNTGSNTLRIDEVLSNCDCLVSDFDSKEITPGNSTTVKLKFKSDQHGLFNENAMIVANTAPPFTILTIEGSVK